MCLIDDGRRPVKDRADMRGSAARRQRAVYVAGQAFESRSKRWGAPRRVMPPVSQADVSTDDSPRGAVAVSAKYRGLDVGQFSWVLGGLHRQSPRRGSIIFRYLSRAAGRASTCRSSASHAHIDAELVVTAPQVLDEGMTADHPCTLRLAPDPSAQQWRLNQVQVVGTDRDRTRFGQQATVHNAVRT